MTHPSPANEATNTKIGTAEDTMNGSNGSNRSNSSLSRSQTDTDIGTRRQTRPFAQSVPAQMQDGTELSMSRSGIQRSLTGDLDDIVSSVAKRAGRRKPRTDKVPSPTRRNRSPNSSPKQVRVARGVRIGLDGSPNNSPRRVDSEESGESSDASLHILRGSALKRMTTLDSRDRFIKMLDAKTLTSFRDLNQRVVENNKPITYMSRLYVTFQDCLQQLNATGVTDRKLEAMAVLIHECMSGDSRNYHSVQHVFEISTDFQTSPLILLAAMFHDTIYFNVDGGLSPQQEDLLRGCFQLDDTASANSTVSTSAHKICRAQMACSADIPLCMVETIFGYQPGEEVTAMKGLNEFLSAVVAVRHLQPHLTTAQCAKIAVCIAGTIPFKNKAVPGIPTYMETLYDNLCLANEKFRLGMPDQEIVQTIQMAAQLANADVGNFGSDDIYYFLDNTWSLLTETNTTLRRSFLFTVMEFQHSLFKMNGFFNFLDPAAIFASFQNVPSEEEITKLTAQARKNLTLGQKYVGAKLLSASVLAAFAALTGGDAPLSLFVGDLPSRHHQSQSINDALPGAGENPLFAHVDDDEIQDHLDMLVYQILSGGRRSETSFDVKQSPLGAFLYAVVGDRGLTMILENKELYPMAEANARDLLACLPREVVRYLAKTIAAVAISRADAIMEVLDSLPIKVRATTPPCASRPPESIIIPEEEEQGE